MTTILDMIQHETGLQFRHATKDEWYGPCPWCAGTDRFHLWTDKGRWHCMGQSAGRNGCDRRGDAIEFVKLYKQMPFREAREYAANSYQMNIDMNDSRDSRYISDSRDSRSEEPQEPPGAAWSAPAWAFVRECRGRLIGKPEVNRARAWLHGRGLTDRTICDAGLGFNPADTWVDRAAWGLPPETGKEGRPKGLWLPKGIVIPWCIGPTLWGVSIRRPPGTGEPKYYWLPGGVRALYGAADVTARPAALVEGELDALTITQEAGDLVSGVATGSTAGARRLRWIARMATPKRVLVAYDADDAGNKAAGFWLDALPNARRWRPYWSDVNAMLQDGASVRAWAEAGLTYTGGGA